MNVRLLIVAVALILVSVACSSGNDEATVVATGTPAADGGDEATAVASDTPGADGGDEVTVVAGDTPAADGGDETTVVAGDTPAADGGDEATAAPGSTAIGAAIAYVTETGLDGQTYEISEPTNCKIIASDVDRAAAAGKVCIHFANSAIGESSGNFEVWIYGTNAIWTLTLELQGDVWNVTGTEFSEQPVPEA